MSHLESQWRLELLTSISLIPRDDWNRCAGDANPFVSYDFLLTLEESGCVGGKTGWIPTPAILRKQSDLSIAACAPIYVKLHSKGEYVFDYQWAQVYDQADRFPPSYYPKLQVAVPFTPVPGPRLLIDPAHTKEASEAIRLAFLQGLLQTAEHLRASSVHLTFCQEKEARAASESAPYLHRLGEQYHWFNRGYSTFSDFLSSLTSRKRKMIRKERQIVAQHPLSIEIIQGDRATSEHWDALFEMYWKTSREKWGEPYLNRSFFHLLGARLGPKVVLFLVRHRQRPTWVAGAWNLVGSEALFGRNWGCLEHFDLLHFEVCYYRAIEYAIAKGLNRVEAGAQGMHKIPRGYLPVRTHSVHAFLDESFSKLLRDHLDQERSGIDHRLLALEGFTPYRHQ